MNIWQDQVADFHEATGSTVGQYPELRDRELRAKLIIEEAVETAAAMGFRVSALIDEEGVIGRRPYREIARFTKAYTEPNFADAIDGMVDTIYVTLGAAVAAGVDLDPFFAEVQRANLDKTHGPKREDGKQLKPEGWRPPDIEGVLARQVAIGAVWQEMSTDNVIEGVDKTCGCADGCCEAAA